MKIDSKSNLLSFVVFVQSWKLIINLFLLFSLFINLNKHTISFHPPKKKTFCFHGSVYLLRVVPYSHLTLVFCGFPNSFSSKANRERISNREIAASRPEQNPRAVSTKPWLSGDFVTISGVPVFGVRRFIYHLYTILLMVQKSGHHQLKLVVYPIIYKVLYIPGGCLGFLNHQPYEYSPLKTDSGSISRLSKLLQVFFSLHSRQNEPLAAKKEIKSGMETNSVL